MQWTSEINIHLMCFFIGERKKPIDPEEYKVIAKSFPAPQPTPAEVRDRHLELHRQAAVKLVQLGLQPSRVTIPELKSGENDTVKVKEGGKDV